MEEVKTDNAVEPGNEFQMVDQQTRKFLTGDLVFFEFELCEVAELKPLIGSDHPAVCCLKRAGGGCVSGSFHNWRELVPVTLRTSEFTRMFRSFYDSLFSRYENEIRNWPDIKRFIVITWQNYCWSVCGESDAPMHHAPHLLRSLEQEFENAVKQIRSARVRGIQLVI